MKKSLCFSIRVIGFFIFGAASVSSQTCPSAEVIGPDTVAEGKPMIFTAKLIGGNLAPKFSWTVSEGKILRGQGTSTISVDTKGLGDQMITASVSITFPPTPCSLVESESGIVVAAISTPESRMVDSYVFKTKEDEMARLDNFAIEMQNDPTAKGWIFVYGGPQTTAASIKATIDRVRNYLVKTRGIDQMRVFTLDAGKQAKAAIELWIVPEGAMIPRPKPSPKKS